MTVYSKSMLIKTGKIKDMTVEVAVNFKNIGIGEEVVIFKAAPMKKASLPKTVLMSVPSTCSSAEASAKRPRKA